MKSKQSTPVIVKTKLKLKDFPLKQTVLKKPIKGRKWEEDEPKGQERKTLFKVCPKCILVVPKNPKDKQDPKNYKFPICTKLSSPFTKKCEVNCTGLLAANRRARLTKVYPDVQKLTGKLLDKFKCTKTSIQNDKKKLITKQTQPTKPIQKDKKKLITKPIQKDKKILTTKPIHSKK